MIDSRSESDKIQSHLRNEVHKRMKEQSAIYQQNTPVNQQNTPVNSYEQSNFTGNSQQTSQSYEQDECPF